MASPIKGLRCIQGHACWEEAKDHLMARDRILRRLIPQYDDDRIEPPATPFMTLVRSIIGQQVSRKSALSIWQRDQATQDRKSTRLNSSHVAISYAVFCLKK